MQSLFEWDFNEYKSNKVEDSIARIVEEFGPGLDEVNFIQELVLGVVKQKDKLDNIIEKAAPDWPISQIAIVDRNVLRIGLFELLFGEKKDVPARVAINEAIELAKTFGGENSGRFVNGVLGTVYKELGEPGKDDIPAKKKRLKDIAYEEMPIEKLGGGVVYREIGGDIELALVHDVFGYWTLSKGHIEKGEEEKIGTAREIKEEMSIAVEVEEELGKNEYIASHPENGKIRKQVLYFLCHYLKGELHLEANKGGLDNADWFSLPEIPDLRMYDDVIPFVTKAINILKRNNNPV